MKHFTIVGGGTGGCALAAMLSKNAIVTLYEKGPAPTSFGLFFNGDYSAELIKNYSTTQLPAILGEGLGGSSSVNGGVWVRYNDTPWLANLGLSKDFSDYWEELEKEIPICTIIENNDCDLLSEFINNMADVFQLKIKPVTTSVEEGIFPLPITSDGRNRVSSYSHYILGKESPNLHIVTDVAVEKINWREEDGKVVASSIVTSKGEFKVEGELILCAGAFGSPHILLKSGLPEHILKEVGCNLSDHTCWTFTTNLPADKTSLYIGFWKSDQALKYPDFQFQFGIGKLKGNSGFKFQVALLDSKCEGGLECKANNFFPGGQLQFQTDYNREKWMKILDKLQSLFDKSPVLCSNWKSNIDINALKSFSHPVGTCSIGTVVDTQLLMSGCKNIRICDASVIPEPTIGNPQAYVYALAKHCNRQASKACNINQ